MYEIPLQLSLDNGLVPQLSVLNGLTQCVNMIARNGQLTTLNTKSAFQTISATWPFPQLFKLGHEKQRVFVCTVDAIYELIIGGTTYLSTILSGLSNAGYPWGATSVGEFIIFTNNKTVIYNWDVVGANKAFAVYTSGSIPIARDICSFHTQVILAGPWMYGTQHSGSVAISRIANVDFSLDRTNIAQIVPVDYCGTILRVLPTERGFVAYGVDGVSEFIAAPQEANNVLLSSYSQKVISNVGIYSQLSAAAALDRQLYVGRDLMVREISPKGVVTLDFNYVIKDTPGEIVVNYDESYDEFYVTY